MRMMLLVATSKDCETVRASFVKIVGCKVCREPGSIFPVVFSVKGKMFRPPQGNLHIFRKHSTSDLELQDQRVDFTRLVELSGVLPAGLSAGLPAQIEMWPCDTSS